MKLPILMPTCHFPPPIFVSTFVNFWIPFPIISVWHWLWMLLNANLPRQWTASFPCSLLSITSLKQKVIRYKQSLLRHFICFLLKISKSCRAQKYFNFIYKWQLTYRSSRLESLFCQKGVLRNSIEKETLALLFSCKFWEISKNTFLYRTPPVAASELRNSENDIFLELESFRFLQANVR